tara:strand:- start:513 stop:1376 length:864 start_codon:yes stop_codon:yes gene_type:complete
MVIDSFLFNGELELLELRLKVLYNYVDRFTIVEGNRTFRGDPKPMVCKEYLKDLGFEDDPKIKLVEVDLKSIDNENNPNAIENKCRSFLTEHCNEDDILIIADIDELYHPQYLQKHIDFVNANPDTLLLNNTYNLQYQVNYVLSIDGINPDFCRVPFIAKGSFWKLHNPSKVRPECGIGGHIDSFPYKIFWFEDIKLGWHLSWMGNSKERLHKLNSHSWHLEFPEVIKKLRSNDTKEQIINFNPKLSSSDLLGRERFSLIEFDYTELFKIIDNVGNLSHIKKYLLNN